MGVVANLTVRVNANTSEFTKELQGLERSWARTGTQLSSTATKLAPMSIALSALGGFAVKAAIDFESSFAGVKKTVNATDAEFAQLAQGMRDLAKTMPVNVNELNKIGEAAGQLGISKENILDFTRVMAQLGATTNLTSDQAATSIAQIQNIFNASGQDTQNFASALVALGNAGASTEQDIVALAARLSGAGHQIGLSQSEVLGFAAALANLGINAEAGGTALSRVMSKISVAVDIGGEKLAGFSQIAGLSSKAFAELFSSDPAEAIARFVDGLGKVKDTGGNVTTVLDELSLKDVRVQDALKRMAGAGDELRTSLELSKQAWIDNSSLTTEFQKRADTTASKLLILWNRINDVAIVLGNALKPTIDGLISKSDTWVDSVARMADQFTRLPVPVQAGAIGFLAFGAALAPIVWVVSKIASGIAGLLGLLGKLAGSRAFQFLIGGGKGGILEGGGLKALGRVAGGAGFLAGNTAMTRGTGNMEADLTSLFGDLPDLPPSLLQGLGPLNIPGTGPNSPGFVAGGVVDLAAAFRQASPEARALSEEAKKAAAEHAKLVEKIRELEIVVPGLSSGVTALTVDVNAEIQAWLKFRSELDAIERSSWSANFGFKGLADGLTNISEKSTELDEIKTRLDLIASVEFSGPILAAEATQTFGDQISNLSRSFETLANISGDAFGGIVKDIANVVASMSLAEKAGKDLKAANTVSESAMALVAGGAAVWQAAAPTKNKAGGIAGGAASGAAMGSAFGPWGTAVGAGVGALVGWFRSEKAAKQVNDVRDAFQELTFGTLSAMNQAFAEVGLTTERVLSVQTVEEYQAAVEEFNAALAFQNQAMDTLRQTAEKYGFTLEQLGPALQRQMLSEQAATLYQDFQVLNAGGLETGLILDKMSGSVNEFVASALRTGTEIPAAMQPMLQQFVNAGLLLDANGNAITDLATSGITFAETMTQGFNRVVESVTLLTQAIARGLGISLEGLPGQAASAAAGVNAALAGIQSPTVELGGLWNPPDTRDWGETPGFASGTSGQYVDFGLGTMVELHGKERVMTEGEDGDGLQGVTINFYGTVLAEQAYVRNMLRQALRDGELRQEFNTAVRRAS